MSKVPSLYPEDYHLPVYDAKLCMAPCSPESPHLEEGMVVTIEPGIYFSTYALDLLYLSDPVHSKFINVEVLQRYLPVGGCRIEDDILVTSKGYENLTTAPKGEDMLKLLRGQNAHRTIVPELEESESWNKSSKITKPANDDAPLRRAPGISRHTQEPILKSIERAATLLPAPQRSRRSVDFEPFEGTSLFSNFKRASTLDIPAGRSEKTTRSAVTERHGASTKSSQPSTRIAICGGDSASVKHAYMNFESSKNQTISLDGVKEKPPCNDCHILLETLKRLRQNLSKPKADSINDKQHSSVATELPKRFSKVAPRQSTVESHGRSEGLGDALQSLNEKLLDLSLERHTEINERSLQDMKSRLEGIQAQRQIIEQALASKTSSAGVTSSNKDVLSQFTLEPSNRNSDSTPKRHEEKTAPAKPVYMQNYDGCKPSAGNPFAPYAEDRQRPSVSIDQGVQRLNSGHAIRRASTLPSSQPLTNVPQPGRGDQQPTVTARIPESRSYKPPYRDHEDQFLDILRAQESVSRKAPQSLPKVPLPRPSLPNLRPQRSTNPWDVYKRHSTAEPALHPPAPMPTAPLYSRSNELNRRPGERSFNQERTQRRTHVLPPLYDMSMQHNGFTQMPPFVETPERIPSPKLYPPTSRDEQARRTQPGDYDFLAGLRKSTEDMERKREARKAEHGREGRRGMREERSYV